MRNKKQKSQAGKMKESPNRQGKMPCRTRGEMQVRGSQGNMWVLYLINIHTTSKPTEIMHTKLGENTFLPLFLHPIISQFELLAPSLATSFRLVASPRPEVWLLF